MIRRLLPRALWVAVLVLLAFTLLLSWANGTVAREPSVLVSMLMMLAYATVGALLTRRLPRNPIGWLFFAVGIGVLLGGSSTEYATYALSTSPGSLPFAAAAAWISNWVFLSAVSIPLLLLLFPTGTLPSRRWRFLLFALLTCGGLLAMASMVRPTLIDVSSVIKVPNPLGIASLRGVTSSLVFVAGVGLAGCSIGCVLALVLRFRRAAGDERQQLRWLAWAAALAGVLLVLILITSIGIAPGENRPINDLAILAFFLALALGIPAAATVSLLKYRLYDLDLVIKKTVVATVTGVVLLSLYFAVLYLTAVGRVSRVAVGLILLVVTFVPVRGAARSLADRVAFGRRATPYEVLTKFSGRLGETYATDDVLPRMAQILGQGVGAERARVWLRVGGSLKPAAAWPTDASAAMPLDMPTDSLPTITDEHAAPVRHRGEVLGALSVRMPASDPMSEGKTALLNDLADQAGLVLRNVRLIDDLRASRQRLVSAQDQERRKLERNIHDGAQQQLVALTIQLKLLKTMIERDPAKASEMTDQLQERSAAALEDLRDLARGIYPPLLADKGLMAALEGQARKAAVPVTVEATDIDRYTPDVEATVYFCTLEALNNIAKYANASRADISLAQTNGHLTFSVTDDGDGFDSAAKAYGTGLQGMRDRLDAMGGTLEVTSALGAGTTVTGSVPAVPAVPAATSP